MTPCGFFGNNPGASCKNACQVLSVMKESASLRFVRTSSFFFDQKGNSP
jgi:hypothetical protein